MHVSLALATVFIHVTAGAVPLEAIGQVNHLEDTVPGTYIVELKPGSHLKRGFSSPHAELYHELARRDVVWQVQREYNGDLITGAALTLGSDADLAKLVQATSVQSVAPVYIHPPPELTDTRAVPNTAGSTLPNENAAGYTRTGIEKLHAKGLFGKGVSIAILDTGIDYTHPDLGGKFGPGNKVAGGFDFVGDVFTGRPGSPAPLPDKDPLSQCSGHGTHVAGIIGANPNNPHNIAGIACEATINSYRIFGCNGSTNDAILVDALNKAYSDGNDIINLSLGTPDAWGKSMSSLVASRIVSKGRIVTFAAGNDGALGSWYTAAGPGVISVGNVAKLAGGGSMNPGSTWGPSNDVFMNPSVSAPGSRILSTWPVSQGSYLVASGTSMAAPFVAGSAALLLQARGKAEATAKAVQGLLQNTALPLSTNGSPADLLEPASHQGAGLIQVYEAMKSTTSMLPTELLLNDTTHYRGSHEVSITNGGNQTVTYTFVHVPAGTAPTIDVNGDKNILGVNIKPVASPASVSITPSTLAVPAGRTLPIKIDIRGPAGLDARQFPVFSGFIEAKGSDGTTLRSTYVGVAAAMKDMKIINSAVAPVLKDSRNQVVGPNTSFTLDTIDFPRLEYRLTAGTPKLLVDLIHPTAKGDIDPRRLFRFARHPTRGLPKRSIWARFFTDKRANPEDKFEGAEIVGRILQREYVSRHLEFGKNNGAIASIQRFANGTAIPDGYYQVILRALKITGDATKEDDWEFWASPVISVKRSP